MRKKCLKICTLLTALLLLTAVLAACGGSEEEEPAEEERLQADSEFEEEEFWDEDSYWEDEEYLDEDSDWESDWDSDWEEESTELDFWLGDYSGDNGTLTIDYSSGMLYYAMAVSTDDGFSAASATLTENSGDPCVLEDSDFIFIYDESDGSIEVSLQDGVTDKEHYTGWYFYAGPAGSLSPSEEDDPRLNVEAPDSIEAWYGEYEGEMGTLSIAESLEDMVDYSAYANDGSCMFGTWMMSDVGLGVMRGSDLYAIYHVEDGSVELVARTEADEESNASYIGMYYPVE